MRLDNCVSISKSVNIIDFLNEAPVKIPNGFVFDMIFNFKINMNLGIGRYTDAMYGIF